MAALGNQPDPELIKFIIHEVDNHPNDIATFTAKHFNVTRMTACRYLHRLVNAQKLIAEGATKARHYKLRNLMDEICVFPVASFTGEDELWQFKLAAMMMDAPKNVIDICQYAVTELMSNIISHANAMVCTVHINETAKRIQITIHDDGVGVFERLKSHFHFADSQQALLELLKGKLTSDSVKHHGKGLFFISQLVSEFSIVSGDFSYQQSRPMKLEEYHSGTTVSFCVCLSETRHVEEVTNR